jgi:hypothetical protein
MFEELKKINERPKPFEFYTASDLWTDEYISKQMLSYHLLLTLVVAQGYIRQNWFKEKQTLLESTFRRGRLNMLRM